MVEGLLFSEGGGPELVVPAGGAAGPLGEFAALAGVYAAGGGGGPGILGAVPAGVPGLYRH